MTLPHDFHFSQGNLQDYVDCRRRFQLRYLKQVAWPALESEPVLEQERAMQQGAQFHRLIQQHLLGIPADHLTPLAQGEDLSRWWQNYLASDPWGCGQSRGATFPEISLAAPLRAYRLLAKYDLIQIMPDGQAVIFDWKTSRKRPKRQAGCGVRSELLQTRVYPFLLVQAGAFLLQGAGEACANRRAVIQPNQVTMIYWFAEQPDAPEKISYNPEQYQNDSVYLHSLVDEIAGMPESDFTMTPREARCRFCTYRSLCDRGGKAGHLEEADEAEYPASDSIALDFEQIAEIEF